jgi:D-serine dehydratase
MITTALPSDIGRVISSQARTLSPNPNRQCMKQVRAGLTLGHVDPEHACRRLERFAPLFEYLFPKLATSHGITESSPISVERLQRVTSGYFRRRWFIKADHALPTAGSIKARGDLCEVLFHAEASALTAGFLWPERRCATDLISGFGKGL